MVGKVGQDSFGNETFENFKESGVDSTHVGVSDKSPSGTATIIVDKSGQNYIIVVSGANMEVNEQEVQKAKDVLAKSKILILQFEVIGPILCLIFTILQVPFAANVEAIKLAKEQGAFTIVNPAPANKNPPSEMFTLADIFIPNETETEILTGLPVKTIEDAKAAGKVLLEKGPKTVIITLGENGCVLVRKDQDPVHFPAQKVEKVIVSESKNLRTFLRKII